MDDPHKLELLKRSPQEWLHWYQTVFLRQLGMGSRKYFITFTKKDGVDVERWKNRIRFELSRKSINSFQMCIENEDTNIHAHVLAKVDKYLRKERFFSTYIKSYGFVDLQLVKQDNGILDYIQKDGRVITCVTDIL